MKLAKYPHVHIDTIAYCNAKCIFCDYPKMRREKGIMPRPLFNKIIDEIGAWDVHVSVVPHHYGEFFLRKDWLKLLKYIEKKAPKTNITISTNASVLDDKKLDELLTIRNLQSINLSAYSNIPEIYTRIIGLPPETLDKLDNTAHRLSKERPDVEVTVGVAPCLLTGTEFISFLKHWVSAKVMAHVITYGHTNSTLTDSGCRQPCPDLFDTTMILHNGDVCGCCFDADGELHLGSMYKNSLLAIWNGERANNYRNMHLQNKRDENPLCRSCTRPCDVDRYKMYFFLNLFEVKASP